MKNLLIISIMALSLATVAQKPISVESVLHEKDKDAQVSFVVEIPQATLQEVEKEWQRYVADGSRGRSKESNNVYYQPGASHDNISAYRFDVYSKIRATSDGVHLTAWFTQNNSSFISRDTNSGQHLAVRKYLHDFAVQEYRKAVQMELEIEQGKQGEMEKELQALIKSEEESVKTINENDRTNNRANAAVVTTDSDISSSTSQIQDQKEMVAITASDPRATKGAQKTLSNMESDKEDLQKEREKQHEKIDDRNKENREEERSMTKTQELQELKTADLEKQKQKVRDVQTKLKNIK